MALDTGAVVAVSVRLSVLGEFRVRDADAELHVCGGSQRLLAFLALRSTWVQRTLIAGTLWPDVSDARAHASLRSALSRKVRLGELSTTSATQIASRFFGHLEEGLYTRNPVERRHYEMAGEWLGRFTLTLRTLDALHLAVVTAGGFRLATADATLARSAKALGIETHWLRAKEP